jgi:hypothetical protein
MAGLAQVDLPMKSLTLIFYATTTFMLGVITLSSIPLALASAYGQYPGSDRSKHRSRGDDRGADRVSRRDTFCG